MYEEHSRCHLEPFVSWKPNSRNIECLHSKLVGKKKKKKFFLAPINKSWVLLFLKISQNNTETAPHLGRKIILFMDLKRKVFRAVPKGYPPVALD